jgi:fatty acid desaturase
MQVAPKWQRSKVAPELLTRLNMRSNIQGLSHVCAHLGLLVLTGASTYYFFNQKSYALMLIALWLHGAVYTFLGWAGASHELVHRTVFKTKILNDIFLWLFSFLSWNNYVYFRESHVKHHQWTLMGDADGESTSDQCCTLVEWLWSLTLNVPAAFKALRITFENSRGIIKGAWGNKLFPVDDVVKRKSLVRSARRLLFGHLLLVVLFVMSGQLLLLLLVTLGPFVAMFPSKILAMAQHIGMKNNAGDFRENSRTIIPPPFISFLYWQMNYHMEHHMYPSVPFFQLKELHQNIGKDSPAAVAGLASIVGLVFLASKPKRCKTNFAQE